jgi:dihydrofolate reductase
MAEKNLIWAQTTDGTIAKDGAIPWRQKADLAFFKQATIDQVVLMGRNTMLSMNGRALPNRINLALTHESGLAVPEGFQVVTTMAEAEKIANDAHKKLQVIGGKAIYDSYLPVADALFVTYLDSDFSGDVFMAPVDESIWQGDTIATGLADEKNDYPYRIVKYTRR